MPATIGPPELNRAPSLRPIKAPAMHDPEFDGYLTKKEPPPPPVSRASPEPAGFRLGALLRRWPVPRVAQAIFAEAFRQGLVEGLTVDRAVWLAAEVNPCRRFRCALRQMATNVRSGYPLEAALAKTGASVRPGLRTALGVGEEHDCLVAELSAFAGRTRRFTASKFLRAIGRSPEASEFAAALARLLREHRLTVREVRAAGQVAADGRGRFVRVFEEVARRMEDGESLVDALGRYPAHFDGLYCGFLESARSREELKACLERLGARA